MYEIQKINKAGVKITIFIIACVGIFFVTHCVCECFAAENQTEAAGPVAAGQGKTQTAEQPQKKEDASGVLMSAPRVISRTQEVEPAPVPIEKIPQKPQAAMPAVVIDKQQSLPLAGKNTSETTPAPEIDLSKMTFEERFNQLVSLDLRNIDIIEALKFVSTKGGVNIVTSKNVQGRVTLSLNNVPLKDVFDLMLRANGLAYIRRGEIYSVMSEAEYKALYGKNFYDLRRVKVFRLKYAIPEQAFSLIDALKSEIGRVLVDPESGNVLLMETPERIEMIESALADFERENTVNVFTLQYAKAKEAEEILKSRLDSKRVGSVKADERSNQLIIQTLPERMQEIRQLIAELDKPTKQVLIDTKIVKIKLSDQLDSRVEWEGIFNISKKYGSTYFGSTPFSVITAGNATPSFVTRSDYLTALNGSIASYPFSGTTSSLSSSTKTLIGENMHIGVISNDRDFDVLVNQLNTIGQTRVLSNPKIIVVNNQEAKIHVGERQAYVTTTTTTGQTTNTISEEVTFVDVGIQLSVTPSINDDGYIIMKVRPEVSSVSSILTTPTNNKIPIIDTSLAETTVMMKDGTTLLIGGLRKEEKTKASFQTPWLGKIPFIGAAFRDASGKTERTELLVVITPHIITQGQLSTSGVALGEGQEAPKDYQEYTPLAPDKNLLAPNFPSGVSSKPYREYLSLKDGEETPLQLKGYKYGAN